MKSFADLKANARAALLGRYSTLIGAGLISWLISALLETPFSRMLQEGVYYTRFIRIIWGYTGMVFVSRCIIYHWNNVHACKSSKK